MNAKRNLWVVMALGVWAPLAAGQQTDAPARAPTPINAMCPIGQEPIVDEVGTIVYKDHVIGFCCPGCDEEFLGWDESRRDAFVQLALAGREPGRDAQPAQTPDSTTRIGDPYPLATCPVSGERLGMMGEPIVRVYAGREIRFCCKQCPAKFEADPNRYLAEVDRKIIRQQMPFYPLTTCPISGEPLGEDGEPINVVYANRLVRFCCKSCIKDFRADPMPVFARLDQAVIESQRPRYPLTTCVVSGEALGSMGEPVERVYANHLVRFCCKSCIEDFEREPARYLQALDKAWGIDQDEHPHEPEEDDHDHGHDHGGHDHDNDHGGG